MKCWTTLIPIDQPTYTTFIVCIVYFLTAPQPPTIQSKSGFRSSLEKDQEMMVTIGEQATALAGITVKIVCPVKGLPLPVVSWQINRIAVSRSTSQYVAQGNTLVIKKLSRTENGNIACTARNKAGRATSSSKVNVIGKKNCF
jgi:hypothetical protein